MGKIIWMAIPTFILISVLSDVFERLQKGHIGEFILGLIVMGGLAAIIWFVAYRIFTMK